MAGLVRQEERAHRARARAPASRPRARRGGRPGDASTTRSSPRPRGSSGRGEGPARRSGRARAPQVAASNGAGSWDVSPTRPRLAPRQPWRARRSSLADAAASAALGLGDGATTLVVPPLRARAGAGRARRAVDRAPFRDVIDSLESLASQVSLALDAASLAENLHRQKSEARFRSLVAHSSDLITGARPGRRRHLPEPVDRAAARLLGRGDREARASTDLLAEADRSRLEP